MTTTSLKRPSPKIIEKTFGYSSNFRIDIAAMMSEDTMIELTNIISNVVSSKSTFYFAVVSYILIPITLNTSRLSKKNMTKVKSDPKMPNLTILGKLSNRAFYLILYPAAKSINGKANSKNISLLN